MNLSSISSGAGGSGIISNSPTAGSGGNFHNTFSDQRGKERSNPNSGGNEKSDLRSTLAATHLPPPPPSSLFDRNEQDDRLWYLALSFSLVMTNENKSFDIYKALSRMENSYFKKSYVTEILEKLIEKDLKITGKYGKLYCNEKGRWIYKQERMFLKSSSLRFLGQGIHQMKRSFRTLSIEEPSPVSKSTLEEVEEEKSPGKPPKADAKMLRRFSTTDARFPSFDAPETPSPESARTLASDNQSTQPSPGPTVRSPPSRRKSISARSVLTLSDGSASINIDQLYSPRDEVLYGANLPLIEQSEIIFEILLEELLPAMTIYESFFLLGAAWLGDGSSTSVAASQRRLLQKVNSRTAILNTTNLIDQLKHDRSGQAVLPSGQISPRITLSRTPSNASLGSSNELKNVRTIDTDLLNELLNDIEENAMINMPDIVEPTQLEKPRSKSNSLVDMTATSRERTTSASKNDHHFSIPKLADVTKELTRLESFTSNADTESRSKDRDSSTTQGTPRDGEETHATKSIRFAPSVPLKRPSWNSPTTPIHFARKRRPGMVVRLALSENGPFQKILTEGVRVVIHYLLQNERRPRRIQRVMMLQDGRPRNKSWQSDSFDINDYICSDSPTNKKNILKLKFFKFEAGVLIETNDEIEVNSISEILTGVHTSVFKKSLNQLFGENSSYEKSGTEKRCFSLIGCISPFDERHCLDIEIQPVDKQKPEELQAASMISLGVATAIQVMSNLANTKDVDEFGMISSLSNIFKNVGDKSPEDSVSESYSLTASSIGTKNSRNTTPPESRMESGDEKSLGVQSKGRNITPPDSRRESGDEKSIGGGTVQTSNTTGSLPNGILSGASTNASMSSNHEGSRYNEKLVTSLRVSPLSTGSPSIRGKRFHIPTILESAPESSPPTPGMKRRNSKGLDDLVVLNSNTQRNALEKHRPKSFTLAPTTPLTPAIMSLFDGQLPSEQYTINHIMQEVVELWTSRDTPGGETDHETVS